VPVHTPEWVKDAVFYQIFPDRFARSDGSPARVNLEPWDSPPTVRGFKGGNFAGIQAHLDHLVELGVNAIYLNPIFQSAANHRYHTFDYHEVDPLLGGTDAFRTFLDAAHAHGIRVVLDGVFNHASRGIYQFNHLLENGRQSPYMNWFIVHGFPLHAFDEHVAPNYACWWNLRELPKLNTDDPEVRSFLMGVAEHWLHEGIDGWRLDVPLEIRTPGFWEEFRERVKAISPDAYLLAEIWDEATPWLQGEHFDAVMNYGFNRACHGFFGGAWLDTSVRPGGFELVQLDGAGFSRAVTRLLKLYDWDVTLAQFNLLSSHDEPRFLTMVRHDRRRLRLATLFQMAFPGPPSIYYGDEIGMEGGPDPDCRRAFPWDERGWDHELWADFRRFVALRHAHPALRRGDFIELDVAPTTYAFARHDAGEAVVLAFNVGASPAELALDCQRLVPAGQIEPAPVAVEAWTGREVGLTGGVLRTTVPALDARVFVLGR